MIEADIYDHCVIYRYKAKPTSKIYAGSFQLKDCGDHYEIWCLGIYGKYQNKGHGTKMLNEFLAQFEHDKPLILYVKKTNKIAIRLYEKVGLAICKKWRYFSDAWTMEYIVCAIIIVAVIFACIALAIAFPVTIVKAIFFKR